ncbi:hypothetical protein [Haloarcula rubripromontorii]|uniref:hypothetical protein n=1 Tax=Haloarcula rubripromontorii TaxID=1705562 RepID=UPI00345BEC4C
MVQQSEYGGAEFTGSADSEVLTLAEAFGIGSRIEYLGRAARHDYELGDPEDNQVIGALIDIEQSLRRSGVATTVVKQISDFRSKIQSHYNPDESLSSDDSRELERKSDAWWNMILTELKRQKRIPAADTGLLDQQGLVDNPEKLLSSGVWDWLDDRPRQDIREAAKTLVVDCSTSSVMLSLRAVEHCLREWYEYENEPIESASWGHVLDLLMEEFVTDEKKNDTVLTQLSDLPPVLTNLYYLKEKRNEVNHPEESPDGQEARQTLMIVASTITEIFEYITEKEVEGMDVLEPPMDYEDDEDYIVEIMRMLESQYENGVPRTAIYKATEMFDKDLSRDEVEALIQDILMGGRAYEPMDERLTLI